MGMMGMMTNQIQRSEGLKASNVVKTIVFEYSTSMQAQASEMRILGDVPQSMTMQSAQREFSAQNPGRLSLSPVYLPKTTGLAHSEHQE